MTTLRLSRIFLQPVKSLRGEAVASAGIDALGLADDRRFLVVDPDGNFLTQRALPRMAAVAATVERGSASRLVLRAAGASPLGVPLSGPPGTALRRVRIWKSENLAAEDCGDEPAAWLEAALGLPCRLVRLGPDFQRPIAPSRLPAPVAGADAGSPRLIAFQDAFPFMVIGEATLAELNGRLAEAGSPAVPMERFRPTFVIEGADAFAEDAWRGFRIGETVFHAAGPCARCSVTCLDPWTGERGHEPLRLLAQYRRDPAEPTKVNFGQNLVHDLPRGGAARIAVGDEVRILG